MHLLITGGAGFIGANFVDYWLTTYPNRQVTVLDSMTYAANPLTVSMHQQQFGDRYRFVQGSILDQDLCTQLASEVDAIVHFAAESHVDRSVTGPRIFLETNVLGTQTVLEAALRNGNKRFHLISTDEVFGTLPLDTTAKFTLESPYAPRSPYAASKASSDHIVRAYHETYGANVTISNCTNNYGPYHFPEKVIPLMITRFLQGKPIPIYGEGKAVRDYIHTYDHATGIDAILTSGQSGSTYLLGGDAEYNTVDLARTVLKALEMEDRYDELVRHTADRPGHDPRYALDFSQTTADLGWTPSYTFEQGLMHTIDWYRNNQDWWTPLMARAEEVAEQYLARARE